jgi:leader peptidase (prepilin peptidase)/N-methyltransferase
MTRRGRYLVIASLALAVAAVSLAIFEPRLALVSCLLGWAMLAIAATDLQHLIIPDVLSLPAIPAGLLVAHVLGGDQAYGNTALAHLAAAGIGAASLYAIRQAYFVWREREGLGLGDVKLAAAAGAWTGPLGLGHVLLLACVIAIASVLIVHVRRSGTIGAATAVPFGAFLGPSIWIVWCAGVFRADGVLAALAAQP